MGFAWGFKKDFAQQGSRELQRTCGELSVTMLLVICLCFSSRKQDVFNSNRSGVCQQARAFRIGLFFFFFGCLVCSELLCISVVMVKHWALATKGSFQVAGQALKWEWSRNHREAGECYLLVFSLGLLCLLFKQPRSSFLRTVPLTLGWNVPYSSSIKSIELRQ